MFSGENPILRAKLAGNFIKKLSQQPVKDDKKGQHIQDNSHLLQRTSMGYNWLDLGDFDTRYWKSDLIFKLF